MKLYQLSRISKNLLYHLSRISRTLSGQIDKKVQFLVLFYRGKENLLSIGKMLHFQYRVLKQILFDDDMCPMAVSSVLESVKKVTAMDGDVARRMQRNMESDSMDISFISKYSCKVGEFLRTETPPVGAIPGCTSLVGAESLIDETKKMLEVAIILMKALPKMAKTLEPILQNMPENNDSNEKSKYLITPTNLKIKA